MSGNNCSHDRHWRDMPLVEMMRDPRYCDPLQRDQEFVLVVKEIMYCEKIDALRAENERLRGAAMPDWLADLLRRADAELNENSHKGCWEEWLPSPDDLVSEIKHHADKMLAASDAGDSDEIKEHLADIFNYVRKGLSMVNAALKGADNARV